jgi:hypothetical protein
VAYLGFIELHFLLLRKIEKLFGNHEHLLLETKRDVMVDDLEEALSEAGVTDLLSTVLHPFLVTGEEVAEVDDGGSLVRRHGDGFGWVFKMVDLKSLIKWKIAVCVVIWCLCRFEVDSDGEETERDGVS